MQNKTNYSYMKSFEAFHVSILLGPLAPGFTLCFEKHKALSTGFLSNSYKGLWALITTNCYCLGPAGPKLL